MRVEVQGESAEVTGTLRAPGLLGQLLGAIPVQLRVPMDPRARAALALAAGVAAGFTAGRALRPATPEEDPETGDGKR
jgi:hypothetical protein